MDLRGPYASRSEDPYLAHLLYAGGWYVEAQWPLENQDFDGQRLGIHLNVLAAWPFACVEEIIVAITDSGLGFPASLIGNWLEQGAPH